MAVDLVTALARKNSDARPALGLGSAATLPSTEFATAAQGALADTAAQRLELKNVAFSGSADDLSDGSTQKVFTEVQRNKLGAIADEATRNAPDEDLRTRSTHTGTQSADTIVDGVDNKAFSATEKTKLAGVASGASANSSDAFLRDLANSTGAIPTSKVTNLDTQLAAKMPTSQRGAANGVAPLGSDGLVPSFYLPASGSYKGVWNAATNAPTIVSSVGTNADFYIVQTAGTTNINGSASWAVGDSIRFNGTVWQKVANNQAVSTVFGRTGAVAMQQDDVATGALGGDAKTAPVDGDALFYLNSGGGTAVVRTLWGNIKASLVTYFNTLKNVSNGFAGLDANGDLPQDNMLDAPSFVGQLSARTVRSSISTGGQGGRFHFAKPASSTTLAADVTLDLVGDTIRLFEAGGSLRGLIIPLTALEAGIASDIRNLPLTPLLEPAPKLPSRLFAEVRTARSAFEALTDTEITQITSYAGNASNITGKINAFLAANEGERVFFPSGKWVADSRWNVPMGIQLFGAGWGELPISTPNHGTIFHANYLATTDSIHLAITGSGVDIGHIEFTSAQDAPGTPGWTAKVTPWAIYAYADPYAEGGGHRPHLHHLMLRNVYNGIATEQCRGASIHDVVGQPLNIGIRIDGSGDVDFLDKIAFGWTYWSGETAIMNRVADYLSAFLLTRVDNPKMSNLFSFGAHTFMRTVVRTGSYIAGTMSKGVLTNFGADNGTIGFDLDDSCELSISNGYVFNNYQKANSIAIRNKAILGAEYAPFRLQVANTRFLGSDRASMRFETGAVGKRSLVQFSNCQWQKHGPFLPYANGGSGARIEHPNANADFQFSGCWDDTTGAVTVP